MKFNFNKFIIDLELREKQNTKHKEKFLEPQDTPQRRLMKRSREWTLERMKVVKK